MPSCEKLKQIQGQQRFDRKCGYVDGGRLTVTIEITFLKDQNG